MSTKRRGKRRGPGRPATRERMQSVVQPMGAAASVTHGLTPLKTTDPSRWPSPLREMYQERVKEVLAMSHLDPVRHRGAVLQCVRAELIVATVYQWAAEHGFIDHETGEYLAILRILPPWEGHLSRMYQLLGLTPMVSRRVIHKGDGLLSALAGLEDVTDAETGDGKGNGHGEVHE